MIGAVNRNGRATTSILLIVGTDTSVGKTWTGCALAKALIDTGRAVIAIKPLETGCGEFPTETEDGVLLAHATNQQEPKHALLRLRAAVAPPEAADREGKSIDFESLVTRAREHAARADIALVEGAGGLYSPLTWEHNAVDLARALAARVLLVASDRLGAIHHTVTALKLLEIERIDIAGVVLTAPEITDASTGSNAAAITRVSGFSRIVEVPRGLDPEMLAARMRTVLQWLETFGV